MLSPGPPGPYMLGRSERPTVSYRKACRPSYIGAALLHLLYYFAAQNNMLVWGPEGPTRLVLG